MLEDAQGKYPDLRSNGGRLLSVICAVAHRALSGLDFAEKRLDFKLKSSQPFLGWVRPSSLSKYEFREIFRQEDMERRKYTHHCVLLGGTQLNLVEFAEAIVTTTLGQ